MEAQTQSQFDVKYAIRTLVLFGLAIVTVMYVEIMLTPVLPRLALDYNVTVGQTTLVLALYTVFGTAITPILGKLGDIYGKKRIMMYVLICYSGMVTITSFTPDFSALLISRTFQGVGLAIIPLAFSIAREQFPRKMIPRAQALISAMLVGGIGLGLSVGAFVANSFGWQTNYHIAAPVVIILTVLIFYQVRESTFRNRRAKLDYAGSAMLGSSLAMIVLGLSEGPQWGWSSPQILALLGVGMLLLIPLMLFERKIKEPLLNFTQLRERNVLVSNILAVTTGTAILLTFTSMIYKLEDAKPSGYGHDILMSGLYLLPFAVVMLIVSYPVGILTSRVGVKPLLLVGSIIGALGSILLSTETSSIQIPEYISVISLGLSFLIVSRQVLLVLSIKPADMGSMTSINQVFFNIGQSLGPAIAASILSTFASAIVLSGHAHLFPTPEAFRYISWLAAFLFIVSFVIALFVKEIIGRKIKDSNYDKEEVVKSQESVENT
ncbi:MAG TPA: MFS transporter [Nitrososphaerales archaeon]|nr:MFS transporter [Nitrososphaerales archaeon]